MLKFWEFGKQFIKKDMWALDIATCSRAKALLIIVIRYFFVILRDLHSGEINLRAMSLVYTTLLSIVPLLAVSFSVLKAFGVHNQVEPLLLEFLTPLGPKGNEIGHSIIQFVDNVNVGVLGAVGLVFLFYTVISLISKIEEAFNHTWHISTTRAFMQRFSYYLSVLMIGPVLVFSAMGLTATMMNHAIVQDITSIEPFGSIFYIGGIIAPYFLTAAAFVLVYIFLPNTSVQFYPAVTGAVVASILWKMAGWVFAAFVASSGKYDAIYSGLGILLFFMIWLYVSWLIFLLGAKLAFYAQHPELVRRFKAVTEMSSRMKNQLALSIMQIIGKRFLTGEPAVSLDELVIKLGVPAEFLRKILEALNSHGLIVASAQDRGGYLPARDLHSFSLFEVLVAVATAEDEKLRIYQHQSVSPEVEQALMDWEDAIRAKMANTSVRDWIA